jgi:hypothetical protein
MGLSGLYRLAHRIIHPAKQFGDKLICGHGRCLSRISPLQEWLIAVIFTSHSNRTIG